MKIKVGILRYDTQAHQDESLDQRMERVRKGMSTLDRSLMFDGLPRTQSLRGIFLAPEYMFAQPIPLAGDHQFGQRRQIDRNDSERLEDQFAELSANYRGILMIPGTVARRKPLPSADDDWPDWADKVLKYGGKLRQASRFTMNAGAGPMENWPVMPAADNRMPLPVLTPQAKMDQLSNAGFVARNTAYCYLNGHCELKYNKIGDFREVHHLGEDGRPDTVQLPNMEPGRFLLRDGVSVGISICYDQSLYGFQGATALKMQHTASPVDIHVLLSAWIPPFTGLANLKLNGYLLSCSSNFQCNGIMRRVQALIQPPAERRDDLDIHYIHVG